MFVFNLADDLFNQIFNRYETVGTAIFVHDKRQMDMRGLHTKQQVEAGHGRRNEQDFALDLCLGNGLRQVNLLEFHGRVGLLVILGFCSARTFRLRSRAASRLADDQRHEVLDVNHPARVVEGTVIDGYA